MNKDLRKVVILLAHPNIKESQANKALVDADEAAHSKEISQLWQQYYIKK